MDFTCVEIKDAKYIKLIALDRKSSKELDLTTIYREQELAYLNIFFVDKNKKKTLLKSIEITNIRPGKSGIPELHLSVSYDGNQYYKIILRLNGYIFHNSVIDIRQIKKSPFRFMNIAFIALAVIIVGLLSFFSIKALRYNSKDDLPQGAQVINGAIKEKKSSENLTGQTTSEKSTSTQTDSTQTDSTQADSTQTDSTQADSTQTDSTQTDSTQTDSTQTDSTQTDSTQADSTQTDSTQTDSAQVDSTQVDEEPVIQSKMIDDKATVYFFPDSSKLTSGAESVLDQVLSILESEEDLYVEILGHCAFYGTEKGRQEISTDRAENVYSYFISNGWTPEYQPRLAGLGHGQIVTKDPEKQNLNRRVEIIIKSK